MIDVIRPDYSSIHGGRRENLTNKTPSFKRFLKGGGDCFVGKKISKQSDFGSMLFVSGCAAAISMITDTLLNAGELTKSNFSAVGSIARNAAVWGIIGGICFACFKGIENLIIKSRI